MKKLSLFLVFLLLSVPFTLGEEDRLADLIEIDEEEEETLEDIYDTETTVHEFDGNTQLVDYEFNRDDSDVFVFYSETPRRISIFDVNGFTETSLEEPPINELTLSSGFSAIEIDLTTDYGDKTAFMDVDRNYFVASNNRASSLIGQPDDQLGFILGIIGGGIAVLTLIAGKIYITKKKLEADGKQVI